MKKLLTILTLSALIVSPAFAKPRISCKSFSTQAEAQKWYDERKRSGKTGWKALDRDKDGEPCECLPGGSAYGKSICKR